MGDHVGEESRLLLAELGLRNTRLYAWPTENGWVCWAWDEGAGVCSRGFSGETRVRASFALIDPDTPGGGAPGTLVGVVPDDVEAATVRVNGVEQGAVVRSNGLFYELPDNSCTMWDIEALTVTHEDGTTDTHRIDPAKPGRCGN